MQDLHRMEIICICTCFHGRIVRLLINGLGGEVEYAQLLNDHSEIKYIQDEGLSGKRKSHKDLNLEVTEIHIKDKFEEKALLVTLPVQKPDVIVPVIEFILKEQED